MKTAAASHINARAPGPQAPGRRGFPVLIRRAALTVPRTAVHQLGRIHSALRRTLNACCASKQAPGRTAAFALHHMRLRRRPLAVENRAFQQRAGRAPINRRPLSLMDDFGRFGQAGDGSWLGLRDSVSVPCPALGHSLLRRQSDAAAMFWLQALGRQPVMGGALRSPFDPPAVSSAASDALNSGGRAGLAGTRCCACRAAEIRTGHGS